MRPVVRCSAIPSNRQIENTWATAESKWGELLVCREDRHYFKLFQRPGQCFSRYTTCHIYPIHPPPQNIQEGHKPAPSSNRPSVVGERKKKKKQGFTTLIRTQRSTEGKYSNHVTLLCKISGEWLCRAATPALHVLWVCSSTASQALREVFKCAPTAMRSLNDLFIC